MNTKQSTEVLINADKSLSKRIKAVYSLHDDPITHFISDCNRYLSALREGRIINSINTVSRSGMSRTMKFVEMHRESNGKYRIYNFFALFKCLGYSAAGDYFRINGCGMDMVFATNYNIIHQFKSLDLITDKECQTLSQATPQTI